MAHPAKQQLPEQETDDDAPEEHPCCFCNDEGSVDGTGEVHPCPFCGAC
jgi:hypothetical protein